MGKHTDALASYDEFRAPWESESGTDADIDKPKLRRFIHNLLTDKAKAQDARDEALETAKTAEAERDEAKAEAEKASPDEANKKIARLESENATLKAAAEEREKADKHEALRKEVLGDLDPKYAKYVTGDDKKSLEESLAAVKADFGIKDGESDDEDDEDDDNPLRSRPKSRGSLRNPLDGESGKGGEGEYDFDKIAEGIVGNGIFG